MALTAPVPVPANCRWTSIPEILYEAPKYPGAKTDPIPFIEVPQNLRMPPVLFIIEHKHTGEMEIGLGGVPEEVTEDTPHRYVDLEFLLERLEGHFTPEQVTQVYYALGMQSRAESRKLGEAAMSRVLGKTEEITEASEAAQASRINAIKDIMAKAKSDFEAAQSAEKALKPTTKGSKTAKTTKGSK